MSELLTLAIETANPANDPGGRGAGVCVGMLQGAGSRVLSVEQLREVGRDEDDLLPAIDRAMKAAGVRPGQLKAVAVSVGPGGFTATRMACAAGAMIAEATGAAGIAVPSALVGWLGSTGKPSQGVVAMACKGASAWCAVFAEGVEAEGRNGRVVDIQGLLTLRPRVVLADGHLPREMRDALVEAGVLVEVLRFTPEACLRAAAACGMGGAEALVPIYPREPEAVTLWRKRHGSVDRPS